jgi:hypothetical protein
MTLRGFLGLHQPKQHILQYRDIKDSSGYEEIKKRRKVFKN